MMNVKGKRIGFGLTGSHTTYHKVFPQMEKLMAAGADVIPIVSYTVQNTNTTYGKAAEHIAKIESITKRQVISTIPGAEPRGPKEPVDCRVIDAMDGKYISTTARAS